MKVVWLQKTRPFVSKTIELEIQRGDQVLDPDYEDFTGLSICLSLSVSSFLISQTCTLLIELYSRQHILRKVRQSTHLF